jgi:hypothetical protein
MTRGTHLGDEEIAGATAEGSVLLLSVRLQTSIEQSFAESSHLY